ncbi:MAG: cytochrome c3 family protein [Bacillota bacterium]
MSNRFAFVVVLVLLSLVLTAGCGKQEPAKPAEPPAAPPVEVAAATYVGSDACKSCHSQIYAEWSNSWHTIKATKGPAFGEEYAKNIYEWVRRDWDNLLTYMIVDREDSNTILVAAEKTAWQDVDYVIGQVNKQRYAVYYDGRPMEVFKATTRDGGISWTLNTEERFQFAGNKERAGYKFLFIETNPPDGKLNPANYGEWRSWQERCIACHTTGFDYKAWDAAKADFVAGKREDLRDLFVADLRVGCEACHGPGSVHVKTMKNEDIINPAKFTSYEDRMNTCAQCHTRSAGSPLVSTANDLRGFVPGAKYEDYAKWLPVQWGVGTREVSIDGKGRRGHQQDMDMRLSRFLNPGGYHSDQVCFDCHNPHGIGSNPNNLRLKADTPSCTNCHSFDAKIGLDGARGWEKASFPNWATEAGRGAYKQHLFNFNDDGLVFGLSPDQYHWVLKDGGDPKNKADWIGIWPWQKEGLDARGKITFVGAEPWNR